MKNTLISSNLRRILFYSSRNIIIYNIYDIQMEKHIEFGF